MRGITIHLRNFHPRTIARWLYRCLLELRLRDVRETLLVRPFVDLSLRERIDLTVFVGAAQLNNTG